MHACTMIPFALDSCPVGLSSLTTWLLYEQWRCERERRISLSWQSVQPGLVGRVELIKDPSQVDKTSKAYRHIS